jgi:hypothetical protein
MPWLRFILYFIAVAFITWALTQMEIASPGSLKLHIILNESDRFGTSEFSPVEIIQAIILGFCGLTMWWVARFCTTQRPVAILFGGMALIFLIRELDYFLDRFVMDNFWQLITVIVGSLLIAYTYRHRRRIQIALARIWPSPGLTLLFAGALILFAFVRFVRCRGVYRAHRLFPVDDRHDRIRVSGARHRDGAAAAGGASTTG